MSTFFPGFTMKIDPRSGLSEQQVRTLQDKLLQTRDEILQRSRRRRPYRDEPSSLGETRGDPADQAQLEFEHGLQVQLTERDRNLLQTIDDALRRIEEGTYGVSEHSDEPIGFDRLWVQPWARLSEADEELLEESRRAGPPPGPEY
jgi:DnaK suppressor protein